MSRDELVALWTTDAPRGMAWACPDCDSWSSLGGNAGYHVKNTGHRLPTLQRLPVMLRVPKAALPVVGDFIIQDFGPENINTWAKPGLVRAVVDGHLIVRRERDNGRGWYLQVITPGEWKCLFLVHRFRVVHRGAHAEEGQEETTDVKS